MNNWIKRTLCALGHHDWIEVERELRYGNGEVFSRDPGPKEVVSFVILALIGLTTLFAVVVSSRGFEHLIDVGLLLWALLAILLWLFSVMVRYDYRYDRVCIHCQKQDFEITDRRKAIESAKYIAANRHRSQEEDQSNG